MTHQQYSTASQDLEDTLIDALTLLDRSSYQSLGDSFSEITFQETSVMKIHDEVLGPLEGIQHVHSILDLCNLICTFQLK